MGLELVTSRKENDWYAFYQYSEYRTHRGGIIAIRVAIDGEIAPNWKGMERAAEEAAWEKYHTLMSEQKDLSQDYYYRVG